MATSDDDRDTVPDDASTVEGPTARSSRPAQRDTAERYKVIGEIGRGGMGEVVVARDEQLGREVAIKRLRAREPSDHELARFSREARIQARLDHPAIVPVHEVGRDREGLPFFVMKRVAGTTLRELIVNARHPRHRLLRAFVDVCLAIEYAHVHGVIHRDIKPDNIVLGDFGDVYVLDWGVAKVVGESDEVADLRGDNAAETLVGAVVGTPGYMSPEQAMDSANVDARTDVYALGCVLANILARDPDPPPELDALGVRARAEYREERIQTARELADYVQRYLDGDRDLDLRRRLAREHLAHARAAFDSGLADEDRKLAIRAASSAMALDPTLGGAAELVGRLMMEPPRTVPPEVAASIAREEREYMRAQSVATLWGVVIGLALVIPVSLLGGAPSTAVAFVAVGLFAVLALLRAVRSARAPRPWAQAVANSIVIACFARAFSPFLIAPAIASATVVVLAMDPHLERPRDLAMLLLLFAAAIVLPAIAEQIGVFSSTMTFSDGLLALHPLDLPAWSLFPALCVYVVGLLAGAIVIARFARRHARASRRQLQLQTWQLRQLVVNPLAAA